MRFLNSFIGLFIGLIFSVSISAAQTPSAEHHLHIRSEAGTDALVRILEETQGREDLQIEPLAGADDVIALLDSTGTARGAVLSTAYFFAMPDVDFQDERMLVRRENEYVAQEASKYPDRLAAFCAVNPLSDYALEEVRWCGDGDRFTGLKLHFANSSVDLRNADHRDKLRQVFRVANAQDLALVVHLWTRNPEYGARDVNLFIEHVLPEAGNTPVQIAHLGGPGSFSSVTNTAAKEFAGAIEKENPVTENIFFDLAEVPHNPDRAKNEEEQVKMERANRQMVDRIRDLGTERVLWGSDWIAGPPAVYKTKLQSITNYSDIWKDIRSNKAPYLN